MVWPGVIFSGSQMPDAQAASAFARRDAPYKGVLAEAARCAPVDARRMVGGIVSIIRHRPQETDVPRGYGSHKTL